MIFLTFIRLVPSNLSSRYRFYQRPPIIDIFYKLQTVLHSISPADKQWRSCNTTKIKRKIQLNLFFIGTSPSSALKHQKSAN